MDVIVRAALAFFFIWVMFRAMGRRELAQLSAFELVLLMVVGDLIQQGITGEDSSLIGGLSAAATMALLALLLSYVSFRFPRWRRVLEGDAVVVIRDGQIDEAHLRRHRYTVDELKMEARLQGIADLTEVEAAVLEPDGRISFVKKGGEVQSQDRSHRV
jgi:uncharacterized membrane protein YcaP (DUF421 family)